MVDEARIRAIGDRAGVDAFAVMAERVEEGRLPPPSRTSVGGAARLLRAADDWVAVSLARPDDVAAVPAWLELDPSAVDDDPWPAVEAAVASMPGDHVVARGVLLGLPVARLGEREAVADPVGRRHLGDAEALGRPPRVVDLSALWAGPLCARLLAADGAEVTAVPRDRRPDARALRALLGRADVVIEASRPRALEQLGIVADEVVAAGPRVWLSITGHGRIGAGRDRVAFGDDAAVAGGLVARDDHGDPCFYADAAADPLTGLMAYAAVRDALGASGRWLLDVPMAAVAAHVARRSAP